MLKSIEKLVNYTGTDIVYKAGDDFLVQPGNGQQDFIYKGTIIIKVDWKRGEFILIPDIDLPAPLKRRREEYRAYFTKKGMTDVSKY